MPRGLPIILQKYHAISIDKIGRIVYNRSVDKGMPPENARVYSPACLTCGSRAGDPFVFYVHIQSHASSERLGFMSAVRYLMPLLTILPLRL